MGPVTKTNIGSVNRNQTSNYNWISNQKWEQKSDIRPAIRNQTSNYKWDQKTEIGSANRNQTSNQKCDQKSEIGPAIRSRTNTQKWMKSGGNQIKVDMIFRSLFKDGQIMNFYFFSFTHGVLSVWKLLLILDSFESFDLVDL